MERLLSDVSLAFRRLAGAPGFTAVALLTLALGIGANSAIFSIVKSVLLRPLPYGDAERLVMIWNATDEGGTTWLSASDARSYGEEVRSFEQVAAYTTGAANLIGGEEPERVITATVTPNLLRTLRVSTLHGRGFLPEDGGGRRQPASRFSPTGSGSGASAATRGSPGARSW